MSDFVFKLPDLGEGTVEAEIVEWHVSVGDIVKEDDVIVDVMTDKANVEVPAPVSGTVKRINGEPGDQIAVGAELITIATATADPVPGTDAPSGSEQSQSTAPAMATEATPAPQLETTAAVNDTTATENIRASEPNTPANPDRTVMTSPAIRRRAKEAGIDLSTIQGSGPRGRILRRDLEQATAGPGSAALPLAAGSIDAVEEIKVIGVRRLIAERMQAAKRNIPHFSYIEEIDVTALESLRQTLTSRNPERKLTYLPLIALALFRALPRQPLCNAHYDADAGVLRRFDRVHLGIAAQTPDGLKVPVIRSADTLGLWSLAEAITKQADAARSGTLKPSDLSGSSITLTSLGKLGGIASTPVINAPEVAIIGVNKAVERPMVVDGKIAIRRIMNLSASFDHRIVDGFDGANLISQMRALLEEPALLFLTDEG